MLDDIEMLALQINSLQEKVVVVVGEEIHKEFSFVVHLYNAVGSRTRRFYSQDEAEEFLLGILTALKEMR